MTQSPSSARFFSALPSNASRSSRNPDSTQANTLGRAQAAEGATTNTGAPTQPAPSNVVQAVETPQTSRQGATNPNR